MTNMPRTKNKRLLSLLLDPLSPPIKSKYALAKLAGCHPTWAIKFIQEIEKQGIVKGLEVLDAKKGFERFQTMNPQKIEPVRFSVSDTSDFLAWLTMSDRLEYALTTYQAENLVQGHLFPHKITLYVKPENLERWKVEVSKKGVIGGGNIELIPAHYDELFNSHLIKGFRLVNIPQLISDLYREKGVTGEAADMLLEKLVKRKV